jgi:uncharacterized protein (TIGR03067 family)
MKARFLALIVLAGSLGFAPAPFPRPASRTKSMEISLAAFQGTWRVANMQTARSNGQHEPYRWEVTHIRIEKDMWTFMTGARPGNSFPIAIDGTKKPAHLNFLARGGKGNKDSITGVAIMRRHGSQIQILYTWGGEASRPKSFDPPPSGPWLLTLER